MQALILAAGMGSRLGNLTEVHPKCMVEVNGTSMIERVLRQLDTKNLERIIIVDGYQNDVLESFINKFEIKTPIQFITNEIYDQTNNIYSLYLAHELLLESDTILLESDLIFDEALLDVILDDPNPNSALVSKYEAWMDGTVVTLDSTKTITDFIGKQAFNYQHTDTYYKTINIYKFSKEFSKDVYVPFMEAYMKASGVNEYYENVLKFVVELPTVAFKAVVNDGITWYEIDDVQDLDIAQVMFAQTARQKLDLMQKRYGGYWRYPQLIDFCYLVNPFYPNARLLDEVKANFDRLVRDYPSGMGVNTLLAAKHFGLRPEHVVIGNGAAELIKSLMETLKGNIGVITPTFEEYPNRCGHMHVIPFDSSIVDYQYDTETLIDFYEDKNLDSLILINPDNPSGNYITHDNVIKLLAWCQQKNIRLILDESFIDFAESDDAGTLLKSDILDTYPNLYLVKSISKSYGVPGFRLGILATADTSMIAHIKKDVSIWNINSFGEYYMQIVDKYKKDFKQAMVQFRAVRRDYVDQLNTIPNLNVYPSQANYIMIEILGNHTAQSVTEELLDMHNVFIKDLSTKAGFKKEFIRIAVKRPEENKILVDGLRTIMERAS